MKKFPPSHAQTATELAVFGAILIFVLGLIVRWATSFNYGQNQQLEAMRLAMSWSFYSGQNHSTARKSAMVTFIEDRQDTNLSQFGAQDRTAYITSASGVFTKNLFLTSDYGVDSVPVVDFLINGQHFTFSTAKYKPVLVAKFPYLGGNFSRPVWGWDPTPCQHRETERPDHAQCTEAANYSISTGTYIQRTWEPLCLRRWKHWFGCPLFLTKIGNIPDEGSTQKADLRYCHSDPECWEKCKCEGSFNDNCSGCKVPGCLCRIAQRYDLDRDGDVDVPESQYATFPWQWYRVAGIVNDDYISFQSFNTSLDVDHDGKEESLLAFRDNMGTYFLSYKPRVGKDVYEDWSSSPRLGERLIRPDQKEELYKRANTTYGFGYADGDSDERMSDCEDKVLDDLTINPCWKIKGSGSVTMEFFVMDNQEGDWDNTYDKVLDPGKQPPGLLQDQRMYTYSHSPGGSGTFFQVKEDKLYWPNQGQQYVRQTQRSDRIDVIERQIRLSNDTGRLCKTSYSVPVVCCYRGTAPSQASVAGSTYRDCGSDMCFTQENISRNCFDTETKILYVRSRIGDKRGRKFITEVTAPKAYYRD